METNSLVLPLTEWNQITLFVAEYEDLAYLLLKSRKKVLNLEVNANKIKIEIEKENKTLEDLRNEVEKKGANLTRTEDVVLSMNAAGNRNSCLDEYTANMEKLKRDISRCEDLISNAENNVQNLGERAKRYESSHTKEKTKYKSFKKDVADKKSEIVSLSKAIEMNKFYRIALGEYDAHALKFLREFVIKGNSGKLFFDVHPRCRDDDLSIVSDILGLDDDVRVGYLYFIGPENAGRATQEEIAKVGYCPPVIPEHDNVVQPSWQRPWSTLKHELVRYGMLRYEVLVSKNKLLERMLTNSHVELAKERVRDARLFCTEKKEEILKLIKEIQRKSVDGLLDEEYKQRMRCNIVTLFNRDDMYALKRLQCWDETKRYFVVPLHCHYREEMQKFAERQWRMTSLKPDSLHWLVKKSAGIASSKECKDVGYPFNG